MNEVVATNPPSFQRFDVSRNYVDCDVDMMIKTLEYGLNYLSTYWRASGRPLMTLVMNEAMLGMDCILNVPWHKSLS